MLNHIRAKPQQQVNYVCPLLPNIKCTVLTLFTVQGRFFCFILSILFILTPSVLFTFPRAFLTDLDVTGEVLIPFLGSGVLIWVLSAKTFAGMGREKKKKVNFSNPKACLSKCTGWKTSCHGNHRSPSIIHKHKPHL